MGLELTIGAIEIGVGFALFLTGIMTLQAFNERRNLNLLQPARSHSTQYFRNYEQDSLYIRLMVATIGLAEICHTALLSHAVYYYTISAESSPARRGVIIRTMQASMAFIGPIQFAVRTWFCFVRIHRLTGRLLLGAACWMPALAAVTLAMCTVITTARAPVWAVAASATFRGLAISMFCMNAAADVLIASVICWGMWRMRSGLASGDKLVDRLVRGTLCSGLLTSVGSVAEAVTYLAWHNFVFLAICVVVAKLFSISLLATLNDRQQLRQRIEGAQTLNWDKGHV